VDDRAAGRIHEVTASSIDHFIRLYKHLEWADQRALESLRTARNPQKRDIELYAHILGAEHVWLARIKEETPRVAVWPALTLDQCEKLGRENVGAFDDLLSTLTPDMLERPIAYRNSAGDEFSSTIADMLTQAALHGVYHRGQIAASIRAAGDVPSPTDYIAFARGAPAATRQR
jgi:uncharacterized damage-inducible protein DinB